MANKPKIRFKGFDDAWEQRKLLSCIQSITDFRGRTPKKLGMDWSESGYLALSALNVKDGYIDFSQDVHYGNQELYDKWMSGKELHRGQVLFTTEAPMGNVAQVPDNKGYILSQRTIAFDVEEKILSENFLATLLRTPNVFNDLIALSSGGTAKGVSQKSLSGLDVVIPKNIDEQNKLADYFINLDNLITLHQRKCDQMKELKKYMLTKMFPQNGAKVPEIRFDGFIDDWEQRKLGDVCSRVQGNDGRMELPTLTISASNGWMKQEDRFSGNIAGKEQKNYTLLHKGELSYNHGNSKLAKYGTVFSLQSYEEALVPRVYHSFKVEEGNTDFIEYYFATKLPDRELGKLISSGARMDGLLNIGYKEFMGIQLLFPKTKEQECIANYFRNLDHLITLHQSKCENLKNLKEYLLRNMFV